MLTQQPRQLRVTCVDTALHQFDDMTRFVARRAYDETRHVVPTQWDVIIGRPVSEHPEALVECLDADGNVVWSDTGWVEVIEARCLELLALVCRHCNISATGDVAERIYELIREEIHILEVANLWPRRCGGAS
jgi:hypothetical protein